MKFTEISRIAVTNLRSNVMRSLLTILGIAIGIATIVFLVSLGYGLQRLSIQKIASIEAINTLDVSPGKASAQVVDQEFINELRSNSEIEKASPLLAMGLKINYEGKKAEAVGNLVDDDYAGLEGVETVVGSLFSNSSDQMVPSTALLKSIAIEASDAVGKKIDSTIVVHNKETKEKREIQRTYEIIGVIQDDSTSYSYIPVGSVEGELGDSVIYNSTKVKVSNQDNIPQVKQSISSKGFTVTSIAETIDQVDRIFRIVQGILAFFGLVALLVASIGMFNTMTIALLERTRDIGIMKAVGVKNADVSKMFLAESAIIATGGGVVGLVLGWITAIGANYLLNVLARSVGGEAQTLFYLPPVFGAIIVGFSIIVGITTGFYPSRRASRLNPLDALRYE